MTEIPRITCACGFEVSGSDQELNAKAHEGHVCSFDVDEVTWHWYDRVFSFWGAVIVALIALGIPTIIEAVSR